MWRRAKKGLSFQPEKRGHPLREEPPPAMRHRQQLAGAQPGERPAFL
ncbi:hypothetical protein [Paenibacillus sp. UNC499MF]|nr:hypothetical protein [Paenibacillus sp. UNC499MF]